VKVVAARLGENPSRTISQASQGRASSEREAHPSSRCGRKTPHGRTVGGARRWSNRLKSCAIRTRKVLEKKRRTAGQDATWKFDSPTTSLPIANCTGRRACYKRDFEYKAVVPVSQTRGRSCSISLLPTGAPLPGCGHIQHFGGEEPQAKSVVIRPGRRLSP
jgi:hypothetical protein